MTVAEAANWRTVCGALAGRAEVQAGVDNGAIQCWLTVVSDIVPSTEGAFARTQSTSAKRSVGQMASAQDEAADEAVCCES